MPFVTPALALVRPLEEDWRALLDGIARARRWPTTDEPARLAPKLARLSAAYNDRDAQALAALGADTMVARLLFSFVRDVPKSAGAVRELVASGTLTMPASRPLRVLDLGAGLGATTFGLARALAASGGRGTIDATWIDPDALALDVGRAIATARAKSGAAEPITVTPRIVAAPLARGLAAEAGTFDVVLLGQVLSELDRDAAPDARLAAHVALVRELVATRVADSGALVIVEPALRDRTRHLHRVRDALATVATIFAPCLHASACPALRLETDWCHEDLAIDLPAWLVPTARGAGLRYQGLTFSYLVLVPARTHATLARALSPKPRSGLVRIVSNPIVTKGKSELFLCGEFSARGDGDRHVEGGDRIARLDRDACDANEAWASAARGDVLTVTPALEEGIRRLPANAEVRAATLRSQQEMIRDD